MKDGGPAFGSMSDGTDTMTGMPFRFHIPGMSLRDYFAAAALTALIINPSTVSVHCPISARAYELADAMLSARETT